VNKNSSKGKLSDILHKMENITVSLSNWTDILHKMENITVSLSNLSDIPHKNREYNGKSIKFRTF